MTEIYWAVVERDWAGLPHALAALVLTLGAAALLFVSIGGGGDEPPVASQPAPPSAGATPSVRVRQEPAGVAFRAGGASFRVIPHPDARWAAAAGRRDSGKSRRLAVAVEVENLTRQRFNPALLSYLLRGPGHTLRAATRSGIAGPAALGEANGLPPGGRAEERLVFRIPASLRRPVLAIQPAPGRALEVRVPLASGL